jgi:hypothetical protein
VFGRAVESGSVAATLLDTVSPRTQQSLAEVFLLRVDPVFKITHRPSVSLHLLGGKSYLDYETNHPAVDALDKAIYYSAVCCLCDAECSEIFKTPKSAVIFTFRQRSEKALATANLTTTDDITVLQAFLIYLVTASPLSSCHNCQLSHYTVNHHSTYLHHRLQPDRMIVDGMYGP